VEFRVSPELATIVSYFGDQDEYELETLPDLTGLSMDIVRKRVDWWINQGVLERRQDGNVVGVVKKYVGTTSGMTDSKDDGNDGEETVSSAEMQHREQMRVYESYVIGMLSNFRTLPVDRIHNMLKMFVNSDEHKYDKTMDQLEGFLDALANEGKLECSGGAYSIAKK
jgi:anaphase-promoting complex subunit 2